MVNSAVRDRIVANEQLVELRERAKPLLNQSLQLSNEIDACQQRRIDLLAKPGRFANHKDDYDLNHQISLKIKQKQLVDDTLRKDLEPYAKAVCRPFCEKVLEILPREIRDIIYDYVHSHDTIYVGPEYLRKTGQPCESDYGAHYWDTGYVGSDMNVELVESWYRSTLFYFYDKARNDEVVDQFLLADRWGLRIMPRDFICKVRLDLGPNDNKLHNEKNCCLVRGLASVLTKPLKNLHQLPNHVHFFIRIHTYRGLEFGCLRGQELWNTLEGLIEDLKALYTAGHRFVVQWPELQNLEFSSKSCIYSPDSWMEKIEEATIKAKEEGPY